MDIITHVAICASGDLAKIDKIVIGNFVTASQAQRKWYTKVISEVSSGDYRLGANSANIIVQNRMTGQLEEEKVQVYVGLGIRILYQGAKSRMEGAGGTICHFCVPAIYLPSQAIRTALDVYGTNVRKIVPIDSPAFGRVMAVCVGAMVVSSIHTTVKEGEHVKRGQEF